MGFTGVVWESRSTEQLARDLTDGPGPASVGEAGAAWVRVANELASVSADFDKIVDRLGAAWDSRASSAAQSRMREFGRWLRAASLDAAANGLRAEQAAVANTVAVLAMPSVSEAVAALAAQDMMASLAAYNGAVLTGSFAEFDSAAAAHQANAAAVMAQYEDAVNDLAQSWSQAPAPPMTRANVDGSAHDAAPGAAGGPTASRGGAASGGVAPALPLTPMQASTVKSSAEPKPLAQTRFTESPGGAGSAGAGYGGGYAPLGAAGRMSGTREYESSVPAATLDGAGESAAGLSDNGHTWLPAAGENDAPVTASSVSWAPSTAVFDELAVPEQPPGTGPDDPDRLLDPVSDRGVVENPVIGVDRELRL